MEAFAEGVFSKRSARDFPVRDRQIIEIDADAHISDAYGTLLTHNLLCAPVWDSQQNGYLGFFDVNDALSLSYDIDLVAQATGDTESTKAKMRTTALQVFELFNKANMIRHPELESPWIPVGPLVPMHEVVKVLASGRARRVPVIDNGTGRVIKIISQMDVAQQLHRSANVYRESDWPRALFETPRSTGFGLRSLVTVNEDSETREAFRKMIDHGVSCVGIVDEEGRLSACVSNKDIQVLMRGSQKNSSKAMVAPMMAQTTRAKGRFSIAASMTSQDFFSMPSMMFVSEVRRETERNGKTHVAVCESGPDASIREIIAKISVTGHHRVFIVDEDHHPIGLISVADICALIYQELKVSPVTSTSAIPPPVPKRQVKE